MRIAVFGDSILSQCQGHLAWEFGTRGHQYVNLSYPGSACCDWFDDAASRAGDYDKAVVAFMGNMFTTCTTNRGLPGETEQQTQERVLGEDLIHLSDMFAFMGKPVLWVNPPGIVDTNQSVNWRTAKHQACATKWAANGQTYLDGAEVLRTGAGLYQSWLPCDAWDTANNRCWLGIAGIREGDMVHLQPSGQHRYSVRIANAV